MLDKRGLDQILEVVSKRWTEMSQDPENRALQTLPDSFWMNAAGGRAGSGKWITVLMYTENDADADAFREVAKKWQARGMQGRDSGSAGPDLIQIGRKKD